MIDLPLPSPADYARLEAEDERRRVWLSRLLLIGAWCRYCGRKVLDPQLVRHPEVCGAVQCRRQARREGFVSQLVLPPL